MRTRLSIAVEAGWRGTSLDTVQPLATLFLADDPDIPGLASLGAPHALPLADGSAVQVWCSQTAGQTATLSLQHGPQQIFSTRAAVPLFVLIRLPDGKLHEFHVQSVP